MSQDIVDSRTRVCDRGVFVAAADAEVAEASGPAQGDGSAGVDAVESDAPVVRAVGESGGGFG